MDSGFVFVKYWSQTLLCQWLLKRIEKNSFERIWMMWRMQTEECDRLKTVSPWKLVLDEFNSLLYFSYIFCFSTGLYAGIKFFIIDFMFKSCPKLRDKYDTPYIVWNSLPTDPQLKERSNATVSRRVRNTTLSAVCCLSTITVSLPVAFLTIQWLTQIIQDSKVSTKS